MKTKIYNISTLASILINKIAMEETYSIGEFEITIKNKPFRTCKLCDEKYEAKGYCKRHYERLRRRTLNRTCQCGKEIPPRKHKYCLECRRKSDKKMWRKNAEKYKEYKKDNFVLVFLMGKKTMVKTGPYTQLAKESMKEIRDKVLDRFVKDKTYRRKILNSIK